MKKRIISFVLAAAIIMTAIMPFQAETVFASTCPFERPEGFTEVWAIPSSSFTYTVGEPYRSREVGVNIYEKNGVRYYNDNLEFWIGGVQISEGYRFKEVGNKTITVRRGDKQAQYTLQVIPVLRGRLENCFIMNPPSKVNYRQHDLFDPKDIIVKCEFTDGTTQELGYKDLEFYVGEKNYMRNHRWGTPVKDGDELTEAGEHILTVRVFNKEMKCDLNITPYEKPLDVSPSTTKLTVNGNLVMAEAYSLEGQTYVNIRGLAAILAGTDKGFDIVWDSTQNIINLVGKKPYTPDGSELKSGDGTSKQASKSKAAILINGVRSVYTAYDINGGLYFNLRDIMKEFDIFFNRDAAANTIAIDTGKAYQLSYENGIYMIKSSLNQNIVFDISHANKKDGTNVIVYERANSDNQKFLIERVNNSYSIKALHSGMALTAGGNGGKGAVLMQSAYTGSPNQLFNLEIDSAGNTNITTQDGYYIGIWGAAVKNDTGVGLWNRDDDGSQEYILERIN